jgi:hypothetical protein
MFDNIPVELRYCPQWVCWRYEDRQSDKPTKVPITPGSGWLASVTDQTTWRSFDEASAFARNNPTLIAGVGFVFTRDDPYTGIDLDGGGDENVQRRQQSIMEKFASYTELSPSNQGVHIIVRGKVPSGKRYRNVEVYPHGRFFTVTGNVVGLSRTIENRQNLLDELYAEMIERTHGPVNTIGGYGGELVEREDDATIIDSAKKAKNGDLFEALWSGGWQQITRADGSARFPSQSEADFALIDFLGFYSQVPAQIMRLFRQSALGLRDKAKRNDYLMYMINRAFDRIPPPINYDALHNEMLAAQAKYVKGAGSVISTPAIVAKSSQSIYSKPPGLLGDLAEYIYHTMNRPVQEYAVAAALGLMAGICGQAYNVSGAGLNVYIIVVGGTGTGKEGIAQGIDKIIAEMSEQSTVERAYIPAIKQFVGPSFIASGQALIKNMAKQPSNVTIIGEFGHTLQRLVNATSSSDISLKATFLDLYNKSGFGRIVSSHVYSDKEKNTEAIDAPAFTLLCESTPETFFSVIDERIISDGLLPRFSVVEYTGPRVPNNPHASTQKLTMETRQRLGSLTLNCLGLMTKVEAKSGDQGGLTKPKLVINVQLCQEAQKLADEFDKFCDLQINDTKQDAIKHIWNRAHIKVLKYSALVAVGINHYAPIVSVSDFEWAKSLVVYEIEMLLKRAERGDLAEKNPYKPDEIKQIRDVAEIIFDYMKTDFAVLKRKGYRVRADLKDNWIIPQSFIQVRAMRRSTFKKDKSSSDSVLKSALHFLKEQGCIGIVNTRQPDFVAKFGSMNAVLWYVCGQDGYDELVELLSDK